MPSSIAPSWSAARVVFSRDLTPTVREIGLALPPGGGQTQPAWTAGCHLEVAPTAADGERLERRYSVVRCERDAGGTPCWVLAVKRLDAGRGGSRAMWQLLPGDTLPVRGPSNHFRLDLQAPAHLLLAGGIGITPLLGMALRLAARGGPLRMVYGASGHAELAYADVLRKAFGEAPGADLQLVPGGPVDMDAAMAGLPPGALAYVCGPAPMLAAAQAAWARAGRPAADLRFETFGTGGGVPAQPFEVRLPRHGLTLQVPAERSLLEVLEGAGLQPLYDCRRGECGLCALDVLSADGAIDHRDVFLSARERAEGQRICICVSRAQGTLTLDTAWRPDRLPAPAAATAAATA